MRTKELVMMNFCVIETGRESYSLEAESLDEARWLAGAKAGLAKEKTRRLSIWGEKIDRCGRSVFCELAYVLGRGPWRLKRQPKNICGPLRFKRVARSRARSVDIPTRPPDNLRWRLKRQPKSGPLRLADLSAGRFWHTED